MLEKEIETLFGCVVHEGQILHACAREGEGILQSARVSDEAAEESACLQDRYHYMYHCVAMSEYTFAECTIER